MNEHQNDNELFLAVFPSVRGFGFALFHGAWVRPSDPDSASTDASSEW
ncbi:MAG: hypothetical protein HKN28_02125 [Alphaproteobacteria bacterium]|nr:hypothetical protein [Alphaproteobacteria bacterium]